MILPVRPRARAPLAALLLLAGLLAAALGPAKATGAAGDAKTVRLPLPKYDGTLTPYTFELGYPLMTLVYDTLTWRDKDGVAQPWLARSVERSDGGRRVTVKLRKGVRWHDGRPLTAADVEFTFAFVARRFHPRFTPQLADVARVQATDSGTVTFDLSRPSLGFSDQPLADVPILPRHLWQGLEGGSSVPGGLPVGSGPYRITRASRGKGYAFRANHRYFIGRPRVASIRVPIIRQESATYTALRRRRVDMLPISLPRRPARSLGSSSGINVNRGPSYSGTALIFNLRRPPFNRPRVRRAVARALDLGRIVRNAGPAVAANRGYIHPASAWASRDVLQRYDRGKALGRLRLPPIRVLASESDPVRKEAGEQVVLALRRGGARAKLDLLSRIELGRRIGEDDSPADFDAAVAETPPLASYDPDFLRRVFGAESRSAPLNYAGYRSERFGELAEEVSSAPDGESRRRAVRAELGHLAREVPVVPLIFSEGAFAFRPAIYDGWVFVKGAGILDKRSLIGGNAAGESGRPVFGADGTDDSDDSSSLLEIASILSLVALAGLAVLAAFALLRRQSYERN